MVRPLVRRKGRGSSTFKSPRWKKAGKVAYKPYVPGKVHEEVIRGTVTELLHESGRGVPLVKIKFEDGSETLMMAAEGMALGQKVLYGGEASIRTGNVLPLSKIPEGTRVYNVEIRPGDGGKLARSSGAYVTVLAHTESKTVIKLPSKKTKEVDSKARATIGIVAAGGRTEKPLLKAGKKYHMSRARSFKYPRVRGKAMSPYAHPAGGGSHPKGLRPASRNAPPGAKVGHIAPRRTGRKKRG